MGMTARERAFTEEYPIDLNATKAAERAGYSVRTARSTASRLLTKENIQEALQESFRLRSARTEITQDMVLKELATIAFADMAVYAKWGPSGMTFIASDTLPEAATRAVAEVSESLTESGRNIKFKLFDKIRALELLAKHLGMLVERTKMEFEGDVSFTILFDTPEGRIIDVGDDEDDADELGPLSLMAGEDDDDVLENGI